MFPIMFYPRSTFTIPLSLSCKLRVPGVRYVLKELKSTRFLYPVIPEGDDLKDVVDVAGESNNACIAETVIAEVQFPEDSVLDETLADVLTHAAVEVTMPHL
jgi:hypothetical protein